MHSHGWNDEGDTLELPCHRLLQPDEVLTGEGQLFPTLGSQEGSHGAGRPQMRCAKARSEAKVPPAILGAVLPLPPSCLGLEGPCVPGEGIPGLNPVPASAWDT